MNFIVSRILKVIEVHNEKYVSPVAQGKFDKKYCLLSEDE